MNGFIELITGTLGGGKTALAVERIYDHLVRGGFVFTNIEMYPDKVAERMYSDGWVFESDRLVLLKGSARDFDKQVSRGTADSLVMLVIDEAGLELNSRDWNKTDKTFIAFNTMARKLDIHLVYISQDAADVDKQIRRKAEVVWVCRNMRKLKVFGFLPCPLPLFFRVRFDNSRLTGGKSAKMESEVVVKPRGWGLYNSDAMVGEVAAQWNNMNKVHGTKLARVEHVHARKRLVCVEIIIILCVALFVSF